MSDRKQQAQAKRERKAARGPGFSEHAKRQLALAKAPKAKAKGEKKADE